MTVDSLQFTYISSPIYHHSHLRKSTCIIKDKTLLKDSLIIHVAVHGLHKKTCIGIDLGVSLA